MHSILIEEYDNDDRCCTCLTHNRQATLIVLVFEGSKRRVFICKDCLQGIVHAYNRQTGLA